MPLIPAGLSSFNEKVESARKGFNSSLDKAGQKSGVFKGPANPKTAPSQPPPSISSRPPPAYTRPSINPPPPPPTRNKLGVAPPPPPPTRQPGNPPPPPSRVRRFDSDNQHVLDQESYESTPPPPPVAKRPIAPPPSTTPYRLPPTSNNGYGPPSMAPVQPTSRYGPPSPPKSNSQLYEESMAIESEDTTQWPSQQSYPDHEPPPPITMKKPTNWQQDTTPPPQHNKNLANPPRFLHPKHGQIPFPPFSQFSQQDKEAFFAMLDEFFDRKFPDRRRSLGQKDPNHPINKPPVSLQTRPSMAHPKQTREQEACRAEEIARYFKNYRQWTRGLEQWYRSDDPVPVPMQGADDVKRVSCWTQTGNERRQMNYVLFPDLSQLWSEVIFDASGAGPPRQAAARFRPPPGQIDGSGLAQAADSYGPQIVQFALEAEQSQQHVARGECWDLANEALKAFPASNPHIPPPLTSISRTHGILLYHGLATAPGQGHGSWKQVNHFGVIRPGDIIAWRLVACHTVNPSLSFTLGDPDHTAIIIEASGTTIDASRSVEDCPPTRLGLITVIEQSVKQIPIRRTYDLATISRGQVWIYRPMAEDILLGPGANAPQFPPPQPSFLPS